MDNPVQHPLLARPDMRRTSFTDCRTDFWFLLHGLQLPRTTGSSQCRVAATKIRGRPISEHCWREKRTKKQVIITLNAFTSHGKQLRLAVECRGMNQPEDVSVSGSPFISCFYFCM